MKRIMLSFLFAGSGFLAMAQDYSKLTTMYTIKKYEDAKKEVDKLVTDAKAKDKAETYMWQSMIDSELFRDSSLYQKYPEAPDEAYAALQTYIQKEPSLKTFKDGAAINSIGGLYITSINTGIKYFGEKEWQKAFDHLKRAVSLSEFITTNGFSNNSKESIDTITILYTGHAAQNMGKVDSALYYYEKLAERKIGGQGFDDMYRLVLLDLIKQKQTEKFATYLATAKQLYPDQASLWSQIEMENMTGSSSLTDIINKYKTEASGTLTEDQLIGYAEAFNDPEKTKDLDSTQLIDVKVLSADIYKKLFDLSPKGIYAFNAGVLSYSIFNVLDDRFYTLRGEGAALKAKRTDLQKEQKVYADSAIAWLEKGYELLKAKTDREKAESNSLNRSVDYLANLYMWKRERAKGLAPKEYDQYDAKYNKYSEEHDKYKDM